MPRMPRSSFATDTLARYAPAAARGLDRIRACEPAPIETNFVDRLGHGVDHPAEPLIARGIRQARLRRSRPRQSGPMPSRAAPNGIARARPSRKPTISQGTSRCRPGPPHCSGRRWRGCSGPRPELDQQTLDGGHLAVDLVGAVRAIGVRDGRVPGTSGGARCESGLTAGLKSPVY